MPTHLKPLAKFFQTSLRPSYRLLLTIPIKKKWRGRSFFLRNPHPRKNLLLKENNGESGSQRLNSHFGMCNMESVAVHAWISVKLSITPLTCINLNEKIINYLIIHRIVLISPQMNSKENITRTTLGSHLLATTMPFTTNVAAEMFG